VRAPQSSSSACDRERERILSKRSSCKADLQKKKDFAKIKKQRNKEKAKATLNMGNSTKNNNKGY